MFKAKNFCHIASNNRNNVKVGVFTYRTTDDLASVLVSGYFNERIIDINLHDLIIHEKIDATDNTKVQRNLLCVVQRTLDNVGTAVIQSKWEGDIEQEIEDIVSQLDNFVLKTGDTMTGALNIIKSSSSDDVLLKIGNSTTADNQWSFAPVFNLPRLSLFQGTSESNGYRFSSIGFMPARNNDKDLGGLLYKWKATYTGIINNGGDLIVPENTSGTLATKADVDLAANSGDQLYSTGVWYAKMYAATTPPASAEVEGRNYADFSQTDGSGNPVIKVYTYTSGAWTLTDTIVPPTEYNGYMTITSKIWDISEQAGQQGGKVLWSHNQRTFTPYPQIISFENAALTGVSTAPTPNGSSPSNQIANKDYVDTELVKSSGKSIDADIVGTLTIASNGQVSGFNSSNYLRVPSSISFDNTAPFEIDCAVSISGLPITENYIFGDGNTNGLKIIVVNNNGCKLRIRANNTTIIDGTTELNLNTKYFIKFECDGINYTLSISTDGITYTQDGTATAMSFQETRYLIGYQGMYLTAYMNDYYIKQNGILVWSGLDAAGLHQRVVKGHEVIEFQEPTAQNNYTWYRKYRDGWVEQGGKGTGNTSVVLPVEMLDTNYTLIGAIAQNDNASLALVFQSKATTGFHPRTTYKDSAFNYSISWLVSGLYAQ